MKSRVQYFLTVAASLGVGTVIQERGFFTVYSLLFLVFIAIDLYHWED